MFMQLAATMMILAESAPTGFDREPGIRIEVDSTREVVIITAGPLSLPARTPYDHHGPEIRLQFGWPVSGWARGYRIDVIDSTGEILPREMLHHAGVANLDRRQLAYQKVERLFAVGRETAPVLLPSSMGVPLDSNTRMALYFGLVNPTDRPLDGVSLRVSIPWSPAERYRPRSVFVLFLDAKPVYGASSAFDVPAGRSTRSSEFTLPISGRLRAVGGHLHDYAVEVRIEEVATARVLARLRAKRGADGRIHGVGRARFLLTRGGLRLHANRTYRVVAVYDNPTGVMIPNGGMAHMAGAFAPDDPRAWPAVNPGHPDYREDLASILAESEHAQHDDLGAPPAGTTRGAATVTQSAGGLSAAEDARSSAPSDYVNHLMRCRSVRTYTHPRF